MTNVIFVQLLRMTLVNSGNGGLLILKTIKQSTVFWKRDDDTTLLHRPIVYETPVT